MKKLRAPTSHYVYFEGYLPSLLQMCALFNLSVPIIIPRAGFAMPFSTEYFITSSYSDLHENLQSQDNKPEYIDTST